MSGKKSIERIELALGNPDIQIFTIGSLAIKPEQIKSSSKDKDEPLQEIHNPIQQAPNNQKISIPLEIKNDVPSQQIQIKVSDILQENRLAGHGESIMKNQKPSEKQEDNQSDSNEQNEESNISGHSKFQKKQKNDESNSQRKQELPTSRKCFNKLCTSKKIYKKIRSRVEDNKYRFFCKNCYENYYNNLYCEFCEQIYSNSCQNEDDDKWIGCDNCQRWNHIECQKKFREKNINDLKDKNLLYECLVCSQRSKNNQSKNNKGEKEVGEDKVVAKQKIQINKDQRVLIFHKKYQSFPNLQYFLQNYSFRLWMNQAQIRQDLDFLRNNCIKTPQQEIGKGKLKKMKNQ